MLNNRDREIIKMALLFFQSNREDFIDGHTENDDPFSVNGVETSEPTEAEVETVLNEFQDVL